uniref:procollagen-proline 4-dioxygenase n=1 Tax=Stomoxys calcitrans TaxID=35570 RepID=A0A1I8PH27_STOCA
MRVFNLNISGSCYGLLLGVLIVACVGAKAQDGQYYASVAGLETLLKTEQILLADLKNYVDMTKQSLEMFEKEILKIEAEHQMAAADTENYLTNPVNAYKLIKRLHNDWQKHEEHFEKAKDHLPQWKTKSNFLELPNDKDFEESALALVRLQKTYNLDVSHVASGILNGVKYGTDMSWSDCLLLGQQLINVKAYNQTKAWIEESMRRYNVETSKAINDYSLDFMEKLGENLMKTGNTEEAMSIFRSLVLKDPKRLSTVSKLYDNTYILPEQYEEERDYHKTEEFKLYEKVCREEITRSPAELRHLRCRHYRGVDNAFSLSPFKIEEINEDPYVMLVHDIISSQQAEKIKELGAPRLERSLVRNTGGEGSLLRNYRISKQAWVEYSAHPYTEKLIRDLHYATGLQTESSEPLQVANYGLGGHYEPHLDHYTSVTAEQSNRMSTSIFYLSDVEQGGATAFPYLKIAIRPTKGTVLFWYNLHRSLDGDYRTRHAGCPVLKGSKWIGNVWTHDRNQDVVRPCLLYRDHESSLPYEFVK